MLQTAGEQEQNLWIAARRYVLGEIGIDELKAIELVDAENFKNAVQALAKRQLQRQFRHKLLTLWKIFGAKKQASQRLLLY
jgi:hypothetical protein